MVNKEKDLVLSKIVTERLFYAESQIKKSGIWNPCRRLLAVAHAWVVDLPRKWALNQHEM